MKTQTQINVSCSLFNIVYRGERPSEILNPQKDIKEEREIKKQKVALSKSYSAKLLKMDKENENVITDHNILKTQSKCSIMGSTLKNEDEEKKIILKKKHKRTDTKKTPYFLSNAMGGTEKTKNTDFESTFSGNLEVLIPLSKKCSDSYHSKFNHQNAEEFNRNLSEKSNPSPNFKELRSEKKYLSESITHVNMKRSKESEKESDNYCEKDETRKQDKECERELVREQKKSEITLSKSNAKTLKELTHKNVSSSNGSITSEEHISIVSSMRSMKSKEINGFFHRHSNSKFLGWKKLGQTQ